MADDMIPSIDIARISSISYRDNIEFVKRNIFIRLLFRTLIRESGIPERYYKKKRNDERLQNINK